VDILREASSLKFSIYSLSTGQFGTGFMITKEMEKSVMSFTQISERICTLRLKGKFHNVTLINVHVPTEEKIEEKGKFYDHLQRTYDRAPKHDIVMILGDLNAKIAYENVTGKHRVHDVSNQNGEIICNFAIENNMTVMNTQFQHKTIHKGTWISPELTTVNRTDHILINTNKKKTVQDVRTLRRLNCDSDHIFVKTIIKQRLITTPRKNIENRKNWNLDNIKNPLKLRKYRQKIHEKLLQKMEQADVNHEWESIKNVILKSAEETIKTREKYIHNEWWDEECRAAISRKNIARKKCLQKKN
jgi:endonuclease/exonuclease/phosphatase family metal-dependent hydrolase